MSAVNSPGEENARNTEGLKEGGGGCWRKGWRQDRGREEGLLKETMRSPGNLVLQKCVQPLRVSLCTERPYFSVRKARAVPRALVSHLPLAFLYV